MLPNLGDDPFLFVLAALVAAIHDFGAAGKDVDSRDEPCHDAEEEPVVNSIMNRSVWDELSTTRPALDP